MKLAIIGSRDYDNYNEFTKIISKMMLKYNVTEFVSGGARGADAYAELYAKAHNIPIKVFPADWEKFGKSAGFIRNHEIWKYADFGIAFWDGKSSGTKHSFEIVEKKRKNLLIYNYKSGIVQKLKFSPTFEEW